MISTLTGSTELCDTEGANEYPLAQKHATGHKNKDTRKHVPEYSSKGVGGRASKARKSHSSAHEQRGPLSSRRSHKHAMQLYAREVRVGECNLRNAITR